MASLNGRGGMKRLRVAPAAVGLALLVGCWLPAAARGSVFVGHSGWFWANPLPQGNTLRALDFAGGREYAVGDFGTVLRSDDGGSSWQGLSTDITVPLRTVRAISPDTMVVGGKCVVRRSDDGGTTFTRLPWTAIDAHCGTHVQSLYFPSSQVGYLLLANGRVLRSTDGGRRWSRRTAIPGTKATNRSSKVEPSDIYFTSLDTGFAVTSAGVIYRTNDGGTSWSPVKSAPQRLNSVVFPDPAVGYAVGGVSVLKTTDGGATWSQQGIVSLPEDLAWIRCADVQRCITATTQGDQLVRTLDGGQTWTSIFPATGKLFAASFTPAGQVVAVGDSGTTVVSYDQGQTFSAVGGDLGGGFTKLRVTSPPEAYAFGSEGALARTQDAGRSWEDLEAPTADRLVDVSFVPGGPGFLLDAAGRLFRTDDGGLNWRPLNTGLFAVPRAVLALPSGRVLLAGPKGLLRSLNGGATFERVRQRAVAEAELGRVDFAGRLVYAYGPRVIVVSPDGGQTWRRTQLPPSPSGVRRVDFVTERLGYALTRDGRVWKTHTRGHKWREVLSVGTNVITDLAFSDVSHGYLSMSNFGGDHSGYLLRTSDAGMTWRAQLVDSRPILTNGLVAPADHTGLALARGDHLLATDTGGDLGERSDLTLTAHRERPGEPGVVKLAGRLTPAKGGERIVVSKRYIGQTRWFFRIEHAASNGSFTVFSNVSRTAFFVAQWNGDDEDVGAGSRVLRLGVGQKYRRG